MSRRGRRPAGSPDAREAILAAARAAFARDGYNTSLRGVARQARVDPALVHHYFPERSGLFVESVLGAPDGPPMDPAQFEEVQRLPDSEQGEAIVRIFITQWDLMGEERFTAVMRAALGNQTVVARIRSMVVGGVVTPMVKRVAPDRVELRSQLVASQLIGLGMARWVARLGAVRAADARVLAAAVGPTIQRYLTGDLGIGSDDGPLPEGAPRT